MKAFPDTETVGRLDCRGARALAKEVAAFRATDVASNEAKPFILTALESCNRMAKTSKWGKN